jgi:hypothetical protein
MHPSIFGVSIQVILFYRPLGKKGERHFHILVIFERSGEIFFFDIQAHVFCVRRANDAIPMQFCSVDVGRADAQFSVLWRT